MLDILRIQYTQNGEWVGVSPEAPYSGPVISVQPATDDRITAGPPEAGWQHRIVPAGNFQFTAPADTPTQNWSFRLDGLPRVAGRLRYDTIAELMGEETSDVLRAIAHEVLRTRESVGDLLALEAAKGPIDPAQELGALASLTIMDYELNRRTEQARQQVLEQAEVVDGVRIVLRSLIIAERHGFTLVE